MADDVILGALLKLQREVLRRFDAVDQRFDALEQRFDTEHDFVTGNFDAIYHRFDRLEDEYQALRSAVKRIEDGQQPPM